ncbi:MAG: hypothetical protein NC350_01095 [Corallococcus sp.]|nr:hypothetical protein [Corallococcus sp.]
MNTIKTPISIETSKIRCKVKSGFLNNGFRFLCVPRYLVFSAVGRIQIKAQVNGNKSALKILIVKEITLNSKNLSGASCTNLFLSR